MYLDDHKICVQTLFYFLQIIPEELLRRFKGDILGEIKLETRKGDIHTIVVAKNQEKRVLTVGWKQFTETYDLYMGDSVILKYNGNSQFNVIIFDKLGREKALSVVLDPFMTQVQNRRRDTHEIRYNASFLIHGFICRTKFHFNWHLHCRSAKNMDAPCGRCKSYLEYHYMNLDDEKKYFSMLMLGDFQHNMVIYIQIQYHSLTSFTFSPQDQ